MLLFKHLVCYPGCSMSQQSKQNSLRGHMMIESVKLLHHHQSRILANVKEIFEDKFDNDVVKLILEECDWNEEDAVEKLCQLASDVLPASPHSSHIDLDIIACSLLEDRPLMQHSKAESLRVVNMSPSQNQIGVHSEITPSRSGYHMASEYDSFMQSVPSDSSGTVSGGCHTYKLDQVRDLQKDKNWCIQHVLKSSLDSCAPADKFSIPTHSGRELYVDTDDSSDENSVAAAASNSLSGHSWNYLKSKAEPCIGASFQPVSTVTTGQQILKSNHSTGCFTKSSNPFSAYFDLERTNNSANLPTGMSLSASAPEFIPSFSAFSPASSPQPQFYLPKFSPVNDGREYVPVHYSEPPVAKMFGPHNQANVRNASLSRFVGPDLYFSARQYVEPSFKNEELSEHFIRSAAARKPDLAKGASLVVPKFPPKPSNLASDKRIPAIQKIKQYLQDGCKVLVLMRGLPGSGKTFLARQIQGDGQVFSTDEFFMYGNQYEFDPEKLTDAHAWNKKRVQEALDAGITPVIVDNTNIALWEMLPYAKMAHTRGYSVEILQPDTPWSLHPKRLAKINVHGVPLDSIKKMKDKYETVETDSLMACVAKQICTKQSRTAVQSSDQTNKNDPACPDFHQSEPKPDQSSAQGSGKGLAQQPKRKRARKKGKKNLQKELSAVMEYCVKLQDEGATEDEIDAWLFMANISDNEVVYIKNNLNILRNASHGNTTQQYFVDSNSFDVAKDFSFDFNSVFNSNSTTLSDASQLNDYAFNINDIDRTLPVENPQPQNILKSQTFSETGTQKHDNHSDVFLASESFTTTVDSVLPQEPPIWENPMPQRRERRRTLSNKNKASCIEGEDVSNSEAVSLKNETVSSQAATATVDIMNVVPAVSEILKEQATGVISMCAKVDSSDQLFTLFEGLDTTYFCDEFSSVSPTENEESKTRPASKGSKTDRISQESKTYSAIKDSKVNDFRKENKNHNPHEESNVDGSSEEIKTDNSSKVNETDGPNEKSKINKSSEGSKIDNSSKENDTNDPHEESKINNSSDESKTDYSNKEMETDNSSDENKTDYSSKEMETDNSSDESKTDYSNKEMETDNSSDENETGDSPKEKKIDGFSEEIKTDSSSKEIKTASTHEESKSDSISDEGKTNYSNKEIETNNSSKENETDNSQEESQIDSDCYSEESKTDDFSEEIKTDSSTKENKTASAHEESKGDSISDEGKTNYSNKEIETDSHHKETKIDSSCEEIETNNSSKENETDEPHEERKIDSSGEESKTNSSNEENGADSPHRESKIYCAYNNSNIDDFIQENETDSFQEKNKINSPHKESKIDSSSEEVKIADRSTFNKELRSEDFSKQSKSDVARQENKTDNPSEKSKIHDSSQRWKADCFSKESSTESCMKKDCIDVCNPTNSADGSSQINETDDFLMERENNGIYVIDSKTECIDDADVIVEEDIIILADDFSQENQVENVNFVTNASVEEMQSDQISLFAFKDLGRLRQPSKIISCEGKTFDSERKSDSQVSISKDCERPAMKMFNGCGESETTTRVSDTISTRKDEVLPVSSSENSSEEHTEEGTVSHNQDVRALAAEIFLPEVLAAHTAFHMCTGSFSKFSSPEKQNTAKANAENSESCSVFPHRKTQRKKRRTPAIPFLDDSVKVQLNSDSWKSFTPEKQIAEPNEDGDAWKSQLPMAAASDSVTGSTQTEGRDFGMATKAVISSEAGYRSITVNNNYICTDSSVTARAPSSRHSQKLKLDKSTMVDITFEPSVDWLYSCFPEVATAHLNDVLEVCDGNMAMAIELMLEWGISTPITAQDKDQLCQEMAKHRNQSEIFHYGLAEEAVSNHNETGKFSPARLVDLCIKQIPKDHPLLQKQLINSSEQRLHRIERMKSQEFQNIGSVATIAGTDSKINHPDSPFLSSFTHPVSPTHGRNYQFRDESGVELSESSTDTSTTGSEIDLQNMETATLKPQRQESEPKLSEHNAMTSHPHAALAKADDAADGRSGGLTLSLPCDLVRNLEQLFGALPVANKAEVSYTVHLDHSAAQHLHYCLVRTLFKGQEQVPAEDDKTRQLREDEALAQWLQDEEEVDNTLRNINLTPPKTVGVSSSRLNFTPSRESNISSRYQLLPPNLRSSSTQPVSLQDIMDEELLKQMNLEKQIKLLEATGDHIAVATKLKREKLRKHFPGIDEGFLEEIFQVNGYCLESAVSVIEGALGGKQPVSHKLQMLVAFEDTEPDFSTTEKVAKQHGVLDEFQRVDAWDSSDLSYQEMRQEALLHHYMRRDCFTKAHEAYRRGMKDVAFFYSQQAQKHFNKMKEANFRASEKMLESRQEKLNQEMTLDLHGFHVDEAIAALKKVLEGKITELSKKPAAKRQYLYVITGRGKHSQPGEAKLRPAVIAYLKSAGYRFVDINPGLLRISLHHLP